MTIRRGQPWGSNGPLRRDAPVVRSDAAARAIVETARQSDREPDEIGLLGGDLCSTLGGPGQLQRLYGEHAARFTVDVVRAVLDGEPHWFVAHLIAHQPGWQGEAAAAMNAEWLGNWKLGPRAHPNDGLVDVTFGALGWQDRLKARTRAPSGGHVPHPRLSVQRADRCSLRFRRPTPVFLDGERVTRARNVELFVEPDALTVVV